MSESKPTIKVYNYGFWQGWTIDKFFVNFKYPIIADHWNLVASSEENADIIIFSHYDKIHKGVMVDPGNTDKLPFTNKNAIRLFFSLENWSLNNDGWINMEKCDYAITSRMDFEHTRHACLPHCITYVEKWKDVLLNKPKKPKKKSKFCSYIASNPISFRQNFFDKLNQYKFVEAAGNCRTNVSKLPLGEDLKVEYIKEFKFNLAFENSCSLGYICEKHVQPMVVGSVPLYRGAQNIDDYFDTRSFLNWEQNESMDEFINRIKRIDCDDKLFEAMWEYPWLKDNKIHYDISFQKVLDVFNHILRQI